MKKLFILSTFLLFVAVISAQPDTSIRYFPDRYKLDIPEEWKKPKMIDAITQILPQTFNDYIDSNMQFCTDCRAGYTVMLVMEYPVFNKDNTFQFKATLALFDSIGKEKIELVLVQRDEVFQSKVVAEYASQPSVNAYNTNNMMRQEIRDLNGRVIAIVNIPYGPPPIINNIPKYKTEATSLYKLMSVAESRIYKIRDILDELRTKEQKKD